MLQDNEIFGLFTNVVLYHSDRKRSSFGSPVFDNLWRIVALNHAGGKPDPQAFKWLNAFSNNPGIIEELGIYSPSNSRCVEIRIGAAHSS